LIDAGAVGRPQYMLIELWRRPYRLGSDGWRYDIRRVGNWTLEEPIHFFDLARWCFSAAGNPTSVYARGIGRQADHPELTDNFSALMTFPDGAYAVVSQTLAGWEHHQVVKVTGTTGALCATWSGALDRTFQPSFRLQMLTEEQVVEVPLGGTPGEVFELVEEMRLLTRAIQDGTRPGCTGEDGRWSVAMCLRAEESIARGCPVSFTES
jgi:myo-inositol 2-dehydrogenase/D-chiro-inositol 1-dehydrogenase